MMPNDERVAEYQEAIRTCMVALAMLGQHEVDVAGAVTALADALLAAAKKKCANVVAITTKEHACTTRQLDVCGRQPVHDRMVLVLSAATAIGLRSAGSVDFWELTPAQAEHLGIALIQVAAEVRLKTEGGSDD